MVRTLPVTGIEATTARGVSRISARVGEHRVRFESSDAVLEPSPEALASAFLIPAVARSLRLEIDGRICPKWQAQTATILQTLHRWWKYPVIPPKVEIDAKPVAANSPRTGLCFTGGVDSFFTLLRGNHPVDALVYVHEYDIHPRRPDQLSCFEHYLRRTAAARGLDAIVVRSNLRRHPEFNCTSWKRTHGAALAAVGHLLRGTLGTLLISSSFPYDQNEPWGSHWELDPHWSSRKMEIIHSGATHRRTDKLLKIMGETIVRNNLRPCWENPQDRLNCSNCEKCLRTQLALASRGQLEGFPAFDQAAPLARRIDRLRRIPDQSFFSVYQDFLAHELSPDVAWSVQRLLRRSRRSFARRRVRSAIKSFFHGRVALVSM